MGWWYERKITPVNPPHGYHWHLEKPNTGSGYYGYLLLVKNSQTHQPTISNHPLSHWTIVHKRDEIRKASNHIMWRAGPFLGTGPVDDGTFKDDQWRIEAIGQDIEHD